MEEGPREVQLYYLKKYKSEWEPANAAPGVGENKSLTGKIPIAFQQFQMRLTTGPALVYAKSGQAFKQGRYYFIGSMH